MDCDVVAKNTDGVNMSVGCESFPIGQLECIKLKNPRKIDGVIYDHVHLYGNNYHSMCHLNGGVHKIFLNYSDDVPM